MGGGYKIRSNYPLGPSETKQQSTWPYYQLPMETKMAFEAKDVKEVFLHLDVEKRKKMLAKLLRFPEFNAEDDLKTAVLIDSYYELLSHLVENGFPWREIASFLEIFKSLLNKTQGKNYSLEEGNSGTRVT